MFKEYQFKNVDILPCHYCQELLYKETATVDHMVPASRGGSETWPNKAIACVACNQKKGSLGYYEFLQLIAQEAKKKANKKKGSSS